MHFKWFNADHTVIYLSSLSVVQSLELLTLLLILFSSFESSMLINYIFPPNVFWYNYLSCLVIYITHWSFPFGINPVSHLSWGKTWKEKIILFSPFLDVVLFMNTHAHSLKMLEAVHHCALHLTSSRCCLAGRCALYANAPRLLPFVCRYFHWWNFIYIISPWSMRIRIWNCPNWLLLRNWIHFEKNQENTFPSKCFCFKMYCFYFM